MQINRILNDNNSASFRAKLSLGLVKGSEQRWQNIAQNFENMTKRYPSTKYSFIPRGSFTKGLEIYLSKLKSWNIANIKMKPEMTKRMKNMSDKEIADKLVNLFRLQVELDNTSQKINDLGDKLFLNSSNLKDAYYDIAYESLSQNIKSKLNSDEFFKKMGEALEFPGIN